MVDNIYCIVFAVTGRSTSASPALKVHGASHFNAFLQRLFIVCVTVARETLIAGALSPSCMWEKGAFLIRFRSFLASPNIPIYVRPLCFRGLLRVNSFFFCVLNHKIGNSVR